MKSIARTLLAVGAAAFLVGSALPTLAQDGGTSSGSKSRSRDRQSQPSRGQSPRGAQATAKVGEAAPDFELTDVNGNAHKLSDWKGKIVVLQWINPGCPVCKRVMTSGLLANSQKAAMREDSNLVWLAINSTANTEPKVTANYLADNKMSDMIAMVDADGHVGRMYGARTTPHVFVIDAEGVLRYTGAFDDDPDGAKASSGETVTNYAVNAVHQIKAGETVAPTNTRPYGCSVKYAQGGGEGAPPRQRGGAGRGQGGSGGTGTGGSTR